jgi:hypothetical protein
MVENENVYKIRQAIIKNLDEFAALLKSAEFTRKYGTLQGEQNKVLPSEFKEYAAKQPLIANKQFYYMAEFDGEVILKNNLPDFIMQYYRAGKAVNTFLKRALKG